LPGLIEKLLNQYLNCADFLDIFFKTEAYEKNYRRHIIDIIAELPEVLPEKSEEE